MSDIEKNEPEGPLFTGRMIVTFDEMAPPQVGAKVVKKASGVHLVNARELQEGEQVPGIYFDKLGMAVVSGDEEQMDFLCDMGRKENCILAVEPEIICHAIGSVDPIDSSIENSFLQAPQAEAFKDTNKSTWGLSAVEALSSQFNGAGIKIAILDTGFDMSHPDFGGRKINFASFVPKEGVQDMHGHGTHCTGTAAGPMQPKNTSRRYGIASEADIYIGKVLSNQGAGESGWIIAGINWAVTEKCHIISMSLGSPAFKGQSYYKYYEVAARRALEQGSMIVAAAGNESNRKQGVIRPVGHPANCPSVLAVAALDQHLAVAFFSNGGINPDGGLVDLAAPGFQVFSSWLKSAGLYKTISGTSMATPHMAGLAALHAQASGLRGEALWKYLLGHTRLLGLPQRDVGSGLCVAPHKP